MSSPLTFPLASVTADKTAMEFCCTLVAPVLRYLQDRLGEEAARQVVYDSQMNWDYLQDPQHWVSYGYYNALLELAVKATGNARLPYEAALEFTDPNSVGLLAVCVLRAISVRQAYHYVGQWGHFWSKIHSTEVEDAGRSAVVLRSVYPNHRQTRNNCLAVQGAMAVLPTYWGRSQARIEELECCCRGDPRCSYHIEWDEPRGFGLLRIGLVAGLVVGLLLVFWTGVTPISVITALCITLSGFLLGGACEDRKTISKLNRDGQVQADSLLKALRRMEDFTRELQTTVEARTQELSATNAKLEGTLKELNETHERVLNAERDAAVGVLAAGMAHELNSPVNAIRLSVQAVLEETPPEAEAYKLLATAERATARCRRIVNDLLCFARDKRVSLSGDLRDAVQRAVNTYREETPGGCCIDLQVAQNLPPLLVDRAQIQQAITNLLSNAHDAMQGAGLISVALQPCGQDGVCVLVADKGPGMSEAMRARIFEPFVSTKDKGKGLGLGLTITRHLIERNGGEVSITAAPGEGTTFTLTFHGRRKESSAEPAGTPA